MANRAPRRDYLYVSTLGVERLTASLPESGRDRLTALEVPASESGAGVSLAGATHATVMDVVAEVESTLRDEHRVRRVGDADLAVGEWFESPGLQMAYGVQAARRSADSDAAVFVGRIDEHWAEADSTVLLSGPARYLQDWRPAQAEDVSGGMSSIPLRSSRCWPR